MITRRPADERGHVDHGWLDARHTFSFARYVDRDHMGFRALRVINEDRVQGGQGFGKHPHSDMEIVTYVLSGALRHEDSMGNGSVLRYGDVQRMTAGRGLIHSEFNADADQVLHLLQIWLLPERGGLEPSWEERRFAPETKREDLVLLVSPDGRDGSLRIHRDVTLRAGILAPGVEREHVLAERRHAWVQVARGSVDLNGVRLNAGDGAAVSDEPALRLTGLEADEDAEVLVFDLD